MKRKIVLSIVLALSIPALLAIFSQNVKAQQQGKIFVADSGVVTLASNQKLRVIVTTANDGQIIGFKFRRCNYTIGNDGSLSVVSTQISPMMSVASNQARFFDIFPELGTGGFRARIGSKNGDIFVTFQIIDTTTGEVQSANQSAIVFKDHWAEN